MLNKDSEHFNFYISYVSIVNVTMLACLCWHLEPFFLQLSLTELVLGSFFLLDK